MYPVGDICNLLHFVSKPRKLLYQQQIHVKQVDFECVFGLSDPRRVPSYAAKEANCW